MGKIQQLSSHVADLIAAGEVVERPASVVKELTENSIDAGSRHITVEIQNGGLTFLRVTDDGCGMEPEDAELAFLRHATSKIRQAEDLESIHTLGFRGEALAATAAVSRIDLLTKTSESPLGISLRLEGGKVLSKEEAGCPAGTTIIVRDLFFNTPARMKFMKRDSVEAAHVLGTLQRQALAHPEVSFRYIRDGQEELHTAGDGDLHSTVYQVYGRQFALGLTPVQGKWDKYAVTGFVTKPTASRGNRNYQQFYVNGRAIRSRMLSAALEEAYRNQLMVGRFPGCVLMLTVPEVSVDVNVHPAKTEVKFLAEQDVFDCVHYCVEAALRGTPAKPEVHLSPEEKQAMKPAPIKPTSPAPAASASPKVSQKVPEGDRFKTMTAEEFKNFTKIMEQGSKTAAAPKVAEAFRKEVAASLPTVSEQTVLPFFDSATPHAVVTKPVSSPAPEKKAPPPAPQAEPYRMIGEALNTYILVEQGDRLFIIDKHAAHERILFEKLRKEEHAIMSQALLQPKVTQLTPEEAAACLENEALLESLGFVFDDFGSGSLLLRDIPADMTPEQAAAVLARLAAQISEGRRLTREALQEKLLHTVACKAAIKGGWHTDARELAVLVKEVMEREDLKYCPHGRPITITLTEQELEKQFGRL